MKGPLAACHFTAHIQHRILMNCWQRSVDGYHLTRTGILSILGCDSQDNGIASGLGVSMGCGGSPVQPLAITEADRSAGNGA